MPTNTPEHSLSYFHITFQAQRMLISKGEIVKDGQDPLASKWNLAQKQYSNNPLLGRLGSRTEVNFTDSLTDISSS